MKKACTLFFSVFFSIFAGASASASLSLQQLCFECTRYELTGTCRQSARPFVSNLNLLPSRLLGKSGFDAKQGFFLTLAETFYPEKIGVIDSSFDARNSDTGQSLFVRYRTNDSLSIDWVDKAVLRALSKGKNDQDEPLSDILSQLDNRTSEPVSESDGAAEEVPELTWTDREGSMRRFNYGVEDFSVNERDGKRYLVDVSDKIIVRRTFDEKMRLLQKELFPVAKSARQTTLSSFVQYSYEDEAVLPSSLIQQDLVNQKKTVTTFSHTGKELSSEIYHFESPDDEKTDKSKGKGTAKSSSKAASQAPAKSVSSGAGGATQAQGAASGTASPSPAKSATIEKLDEKRLYTYDEEDRLIQEEKTLWRYSKNAKGKETSEHSDYRWLYSYGPNASLPDTEYFEDGKLRVRTVYASENCYTETMYFDGGYEVKADYADGSKVLEVISMKGQELRRSTFEE